MIRPPKESLRYSILLILLLATGAIAVGITISFLDNAVPDSTYRQTLTIVIWVLTMGFMFIAGAFGLWAIHFSAETESLRRISLLVDRMNDISDGILAIDKQGKIIGMNAAATQLFGESHGMSITERCGVITNQEKKDILGTSITIEKEYHIETDDLSARTLRFRIQPAISGISLILVSDITSVAAARTRQRRAASLQLAGHMAKGIANDFNDLLCGISGHASLLARPNVSPKNILSSSEAIQKFADNGIRLARQLVQLSNSQLDSIGNFTTQLTKHITNGVDLLESSLDPSWKLICDVAENLPPVNIPPNQLEHIIHNLGLIVAETTATKTKQIHIKVHSPITQNRFNHGTYIAAVLEIFCETSHMYATDTLTEDIENGVISSLVQNLITQVGGKFEAIPDGRRTNHFRIFMPGVDSAILSTERETEESLAVGIEAYTAGWHVLLGIPAQSYETVITYFKDNRIQLNTAHDENTFLQNLTNTPILDTVFIQPDILGQNFDAILPITKKLCPSAGIVLLTDDMATQMPKHVTRLSPNSPPSKWIHAMIEARSKVQANAPSNTSVKDSFGRET